MKRGNAIVQGYRLANQVDCHVVAADLVCDDAKKMEAIDVILIDREDFSVMALCLGKLAGLMMAQRRGQLVGNPTPGAGGRARWRRSGDSRPLLGCPWSLFSLHGEVTRCKPTSPNMTAGRT